MEIMSKREMKVAVIFGAPGSGKGTQSALLAKRAGFVTVCSSDILRNAVGIDNDMGLVLKEVMSRGELVSDDLICSLVEKNVKKLSNSCRVLFDGFPRNLYQAMYLDDVLLRYMSVRVSRVVVLDIPHDVLVRRLLNRVVCVECGSTGSVENRNHGSFTCSVCKSNDFKCRNDDTDVNVIRKRLREYDNQINLLSEYYKQVITIVIADDTVERVFTKVKDSLMV